MVLSIIVISHNQKEKLKRCVDSIITQDLPFSYEVIISDDASNDGTWELAQYYASQYPQIKAYSCNTSIFQPANTSDRCGWNKCNAYQYTTGKYIAHVDGDDFFIAGKDIYKKQVELLEKNTNCSCCMANNYDLSEDEDVSKAKLRHKEGFKSGAIISSEEYIRKYFREFQCFVFRRNNSVDPIKLYGGYYDDSVITDHHIQFGDIVCLDDAGYVYVHSDSSIWSKQVKCNDFIVFAHALYIPSLIPRWTDAFYSETYHHVQIYKVVRLALSRHQLKESNLRWINKFDVYLYHAFNRHLNVKDWFHLLFLLVYLRLIIRFKLNNRLFSKVLRLIV